MNIKDRLYISVIISIILVVLLFSVNLVTSNRVAEESKKNELAHHLHQAISELDVVTYEYLLHHEKRMKQQWNLKYNSTKEILEELEEVAGEPIKSMRADYTDLSDLFSQVIVNYEKEQELIQEGASQEKIDTTVLLEERLVIQLLIKSQSIVSDVSRFEEKSTIETKESQELADNLTLILTIILAVTVTTTSLLVARSISKPLDKLIKGVEIVGKGNLKHRIDIKGKDEIGDLATSFNEMSRKLRKSYSSLEQKVKERTRELEEAKNRSEVLLSSIGDGVFAIDRERNIIHFNRTAEELSGYKASDVVGKPYYDALHFVKEKDRSENIGFIRKAFRGETTDMADETVLIRKDQSELPVVDSAAPIKNEKGEVIGVIVVFRDAKKERKIQQMRSEFMSLASHELKAPLGVIKGYLEMLTDETTGKLTKEQQKLIDIAVKASNNLLKLTYDLLETARLEEGRVKTEPIMVDPIDLAEKTITTELRQAFKQKKQKFTFKKPESLPKIKVDPKFIMTPIQNLLSNASKYTPEKGKIEFEVSQKENRIIFKVADSGIGIPKEQQFRVFQRFFRASNTTHLERGTGLGLYMAKLMIEMSGGRIWFESEERKGTTFYFTLPIKQ